MNKDEEIKMMCIHIHTRAHTGILLSHKNENLPFAAMWVGLEGSTLRNKSDRERQILYDITYIWNLKTKAIESI